MSINRLYEYCGTWYLQFNIQKTKIIVFRKQRATKRNERWVYVNENKDIVNDVIDLGVTHNYTVNISFNTNTLPGKGFKALTLLLSSMKT